MSILFTDPCFLDHETGNHPECPARIQSLLDMLARSPVTEHFARGQIQTAPDPALEAVHDSMYLESLREFAEEGGGRADADTVVCPVSVDVAALAAGSGMAAVDEVLSGRHREAICLIRPPGHHARPRTAMGFCLFNNIAVAAVHARKAWNLQRVLIVDWDVHHGNGTQEIFYRSGDVVFFSAHRFPFYPGTGESEETGEGSGLGATFNLPLSFGVSRQEYLARFETMLSDAARRANPELVLISAGFDAHSLDPIGSLGLDTEDFGTLTRMVQNVARHYCGGKLVSMLEGGYHLQALADSVEVHMQTLIEETP